MHCPRCGQQQASNELKFCSRCGFQLHLVAEILQNNGHLPILDEITVKSPRFFTRRNGVVFSIMWVIFFLLIMTPFWGIAGVDELAGMSAIVGIFGGLMWLIGSLLVLKPHRSGDASKNALPASVPAPGLYGNPEGRGALPPQREEPASVYAPPQAGSWRAPDTGEFARPGSVTESTTKLLRKEEENDR